MTMDTKLRQGTTARFEMLGTSVSEAASRFGLSPEITEAIARLIVYTERNSFCRAFHEWRNLTLESARSEGAIRRRDQKARSEGAIFL
ncbi:hypothetical protein [Gluconacetobacter tumulisoli]|uniref:Uncharacterized protein n=1 Tax=Gluconacetobacter tumulisoli TaxID=1286189 RepID=A0A7W4K8D8_9PROT|nr:hypothetical protein [Gluconacetobacter tumulisoli]MBB2202236.1 hypothetical protein [Gluconacetobacter tumulisoli]